MLPPSDIQDAQALDRALETESARSCLQLSLFRLGVECRVDEHEVTLSGALSTYYEKQLAQEIVMGVTSQRVKNRCVVKKDRTRIRSEVGN